MPPVYIKPENALRRAEELLALGTVLSKAQAFEFLSEVFQSKRFKQTPIATLEPIIIKYLDLCIELQRKSDAREALVQYKNAAQNTSVASIERVLVHFIDAAEARLAAAQAQAASEVAALPAAPAKDGETEDDDLPLQPTALLFDSFIDSAGDRERVERRIVNPAQRFCWDAYEVSLDIAKSNDRLEVIYQTIAHRALRFCKEHSRKGDFRRLCEQRLRKDLANATKYGHQQHAVNLADPETLTRHLDTRFLQLETAVELELWQEAFRSVEDVHGLIAGKKGGKPAMMADYYHRLTQIFKAEGGKQTAVFHAAAWARYYQAAERAGTVGDKASALVLLSAIAVPLGDVETKQRLIALLNLPKMPTRDALVADAAAKHLRRVPAAVRQLYQIIEADFQPLKAAKQLAPLIASLTDGYAAYLPALHDVVLSRLVQGLSRVYDTVSLDHILSLVKPFDDGPWATDMPALEKFLMTAARRGDINATVDHVAHTISFVAPPANLNRLADLAVCLHSAVQYLTPTPPVARADAFAAAIAQAEEERKQMQHRRLIVQKRRELMEEAALRREKEESTARAERARQAAEDAAKREREAARQADIDRLQRQMEATRRDEARKLAEQLAAKGALKVDLSELPDDDLDTSKIVALQVEHIAKEKRELGERLRIIGKRVDHLERAFRKEERPLLAQDYERQKAEDRTAHDAAQVAARALAVRQQADTRALKDRLGRMMPDYLEARKSVEATQQLEFEQARAAAQQKIAEEKEKFKAKVLERRRAEREARERARAEDEARARAEEEEAAERERQLAEQADAEARAAADVEQRKREAAERAEKARAEREAQRERDLEQVRRQQQREEEAEARRRERAAGGGGAAPAPAHAPPPAAVGLGAGAGGAYRPGAFRSPAAAATTATTANGAAAPPADAAAAPAAPTAVRPGGWRERAAAKAAAGGDAAAAPSPPSASPAPPSAPAPAPAPAAQAPAQPPAADGQPQAGGTWRRGSGARGGMTRGGAPTARGGGGGGGASRW